jgi:hypothetical protein
MSHYILEWHLVGVFYGGSDTSLEEINLGLSIYSAH